MCRWDGHWHAFFRVRVPDAYFLAAGIGGVAALLGVFIGPRVRNAELYRTGIRVWADVTATERWPTILSPHTHLQAA